MPKATFVAKGQIRGLLPPKDGAEHVLEAGGEIVLDSEHPEAARLAMLGALVAKSAAKPADSKKPE